MQLSLPDEIQRKIDERVKSGQYENAEGVIAAAIASLAQQERLQEFAPGEIDALLAEGEKDIANDDVIDGDAFFAEIRRMSAARRGAKR